MNRRSFLSLGAASSAAVAQEISRRTESPALRFLNRKAGIHPFRARPVAQRPHIFVICVDMITPDHFHPSRTLHREMDLPNIRSIAADGVVFNNALCVAPLCAPARAATATGRYPYITANGERAHDGHETILRPSDVIFQEYLKATGYITKHCGKGHLGTQKFMDAFDENSNAWDRWAPPIFDDEVYLAYLNRLGVKQQRYKKEIVGLQQDRNTRQVSLGGWIEQSDGKPFPLEAQYSYHLAERAIEKLDAAMAHSAGKDPIYLQLDFFDPHQPFSVPDGFEKRAAELRKAFSLPASYEKIRARDWRAAPDEPKIYHFYRKNWGLYNAETVRDYRVANALQMEVVDRAVGRFLGELKRRGLYEDSIVVFMADHGEMNGREALVDKGVYLHPDVLRIPLYVKMPGVKHRTVDAPVSQLDLAPTLLEVAGVEPEARLDGRSLTGLLRGTAPEADRDLLFECGWHVGVNFACAIQQWSRAGHYLYAYNLSSEVDELRDMSVEDSVNLAGKPEHARRYKEMVGRMGAFLERDHRWIGYWHSFRIDRYHDLPKREMGDTQMFRPI